MRKILSILAISSLLLSFGCDKKEEGPGYYFKFKADGIAYEYKYECDESPIFNGGCNMGAGQGPTSTFNPYFIYAEDPEVPSARGEVRFFLNKEDFDNLDTIVLDGSRNWVEANSMPNGRYNAGYVLDLPLTGKIIFTEKNSTYLKGLFAFESFKIVMNEETGSSERTDTVVNFSEGKFFVGRSN